MLLLLDCGYEPRDVYMLNPAVGALSVDLSLPRGGHIVTLNQRVVPRVVLILILSHAGVFLHGLAGELRHNLAFLFEGGGFRVEGTGVGQRL